jgi:prepilin-type N-terminal cleavage/methylation domain-containing protein
MKSTIKSNGFTLIEILVSLVILAISLLAMAGLMVTTTRNNSLGAHITEASTLAQSALETLRTVQWTAIVSQPVDPNPAKINGVEYNRVWTVAMQPAPPNDLLRVVNITVTWTDSRNHSIAFGPYNIMRPPGQ